MARENYKKLMTENGTLKHVSFVPLTDKQEKGFKRFCKCNDTPAGNDRINNFFVYCGRFGYAVHFIKTRHSGNFAKIRVVFAQLQ